MCFVLLITTLTLCSAQWLMRLKKLTLALQFSCSLNFFQVQNSPLRRGQKDKIELPIQQSSLVIFNVFEKPSLPWFHWLADPLCHVPGNTAWEMNEWTALPTPMYLAINIISQDPNITVTHINEFTAHGYDYFSFFHKNKWGQYYGFSTTISDSKCKFAKQLSGFRSAQ